MKAGLVCIGLTTLDVVARPIDRIPQDERTTLIEGIGFAPAGTAAGTAMVAAQLGVSVRLISAVGDDQAGRFVRFALEEAGVDTMLLEILRGQPTSATLLTVDSEGRRPNFHVLGAGMLTTASSKLGPVVSQAKFLHYAGIGGRNLDGGPGAALVFAAQASGCVTTCDLISPRRSALEELTRVLPAIDYFMPSAAEARLLTGHDDLVQAAEVFLGLGAGACIIKDGARGALAVLGGRPVRLPAYAITPVDTTSCGDAFCAGFIAALDRGRPPIEAARFAMATAALVAQGLATLGKLQNFDATDAAMRDMPLNEAA